MSKKPFKIKWKDIFRTGNLLFQITWRIGLFFLVLGLLLFVYRGLKNNNFAIEAFHVPKEFSDAGLDGIVLANKILDEVKAVDAYIASQKERPTDVQSGIQPDLNFQVMGIGLTINSITYFLKELLGKERRAISGELTDIDQTLELTLRISSHDPKQFSIPYALDKRKEALDHLFHEAAKEVIGIVDPYRLSVYYYKKGDFEKAMELILDIITNHPEETPWAYLAWGNLLNKQNRTDEACEKFKKAIQYKPDFKLAYANWAWNELRRSNYTAAIPLFEKANLGYPKEANYYNGLAVCHRNLGEQEKAAAFYAKAAAIDPAHIIWWNGNWADMKFREQKDTLGAIKLMKEAAEKMPEGPEKYLAYAACFFYKNNPDSANIMATKALEIAPNNILALDQVSKYSYYNGDYEKSITLHKKEIEVLTKGKDIENRLIQLQNAYNVLAMSEYQVAAFDSALVHVQKAIDIDPQAAFPYTTLAETYAFMGDHEKFYEAVTLAVNRGFNFEPYLDQAPYSRYKEEPKFRQLVSKEEKKLEGSLAAGQN